MRFMMLQALEGLVAVEKGFAPAPLGIHRHCQASVNQHHIFNLIHKVGIVSYYDNSPSLKHHLSRKKALNAL
jgi:hypothetical protein